MDSHRCSNFLEGAAHFEPRTNDRVARLTTADQRPECRLANTRPVLSAPISGINYRVRRFAAAYKRAVALSLTVAAEEREGFSDRNRAARLKAEQGAV